MLYIVPTPVGNLKDITLRAIDTLKSVSLILCEDTRTSGVLMKHYDIHTPLKAYHQFNEHKITSEIVELLAAGGNVANGNVESGNAAGNAVRSNAANSGEHPGKSDIALITDAGTPAISDPGFLLVRACAEAGIEVECLPGATAIIPALVQSALPCEKFIFEGFLPRQKGRQTKLQALKEEERTFAFYESPFRLVKTLQQLAEILGTERKAAVCREISKLHAETKRGTLKELAEYYETHVPKGEIVVVVAGKPNEKISNKQEKE